MRPPLSLRADGVTPMAVYCAVGAIRWVMADDGDAQSDDDGGRWGEATAEARLYNVAPGWLAYLGLVVERKK